MRVPTEVEHLILHYTPRLNGKVERSLLIDKEEFYQLLTYTDDVDLNEKLKEWEDFYNYHRPHSAHKGKSPYEVLKEKMQAVNQSTVSPPESKEAAPAVKTAAQPLPPSMVPSLEAETFCERVADGLR